MKFPILFSLLAVFASTNASPTPLGKSEVLNFIGLPLANNAKVQDTVPDCYLAVYHSNATTMAVLAHQRRLTKRIAKRGMGEMMQTYQISGWNAFAIQTDEKTMLEIYNEPEVSYADVVTLLQNPWCDLHASEELSANKSPENRSTTSKRIQ